MKDRAIFDLDTYDNTLMFCGNCANILTVFFNVDGAGRVHCPKCNCDFRVKRFRRKYRIELFKPQEHEYYNVPGCVTFNTKAG